MQQQQHGEGGGGGGRASGGGPAQQFGAQQVEMPPPFSPVGGAGQRISLAEAPSPISRRPPASAPAQQYDELGPSGAGAVGFDAEGLAAAAAGEEGASGGSAGNRWPRQETLELLKIRSDMDTAFRDATLKGPLWEQVSRKLAEKGYNRSAKKCKEKFENVHKYYKRTKESRAGRNDGKTYRFFTQLEALHGTGAAPASVASQVPPAISSGASGAAGPSAVHVPAEPLPAVSAGVGMPMTTVGYPSFSTSNTEDYTDEDDSDDEGTEELVGGGADEGRKRKRVSESEGGGGSGKMMRFFEGLMKQVMERQEAMQQRFLEAIEKREQDRMIREEAWRRQEMTRLAREQEILAQERAMAASRDAAVLSFIQKITGQTMPMPSIAAPTINAMPPPSHPKPPPPPQPHPTPIASASPAPLPPQPPASQTPPPQQQQPSPQQQKSSMPATPRTPAPQQQSTDIVMIPAETTPHEGSGGGATSSRWPKAEVHALIQLRSTLDTRYQEAGPKGPLWEEISAGMRRMGYNRNAKRCKEKWENINKYFKKVKESNKKRPEDSKTCPYFHQLDALYRNKAALSYSSGAGAAVHANASSAPQEMVTVVTAAAPISQTPPPPTQPSQSHHAAKNGGSSNSAGTGTGNGGCASSEHGSRGMQTQASNGSAAASRFVGEGGGGAASAAKKPEDIMKEMMEQRQPQPQAVVSGYNGIEGAGGNNMDDDDYDEDDYDEDDDEDDDCNKMQYEIQFQRQQQHHHQQQPNAVRSNAGAGGGNPPGTAAPSTAAAPTTTAGSFLGMVQ